MKIEYDPAKNDRNIRERQLPFDRASDFDWDTAIIAEDVRNEYPERRFVAVSYLDERLHVLCFTPVSGGIRVISFRKANSREVRRYEQEIADR
ncbi:BrnT family toxin [Pelagibacterium halotolerans]|uniref:BrnT family toxin n=1 Tax=Pelagibacterium halotolerans TaxID=531813 RepID=UPI0038500408